MSEGCRLELLGRMVHKSAYGPFGNRLRTRMNHKKIYGPFAVKKTIGMNHKHFYGSLVNHFSKGWTGKGLIHRILGIRHPRKHLKV